MYQVSAILSLLIVSSALAQSGKDGDPAVAAARKRQDFIKSATIEYKRIDVETAGSRTSDISPNLKPLVKNRVPDRQTTSESKNRVLLEGGKIRIEDNHPRWNVSKGLLVPTAVIAVADEETGKILFPSGLSGDQKPAGFLQGAGDRTEFSDACLNPILIHFRGIHPEVCPYPLTTVKPSGISLPIDGSICKEYSVALGKLDVRVWVDPSKEFAVRRLTKAREKQLTHRLDVEYRQDPKWGWLPKSWVIHEYSTSGGLLRTTRIEVLDLRVGEPVDTSQFELQFPAETFVYDRRVNKFYNVQANGTMKEEIREKSPGQVAAQDTDGFVQSNKWLLFCLLAIVFLTGLVLILRKRIPRVF
jgi:hypothetical protein